MLRKENMSTNSIDTKTFIITVPLWGGYKMFDHGSKEPWVGVALDKLQSAEKINLTLAYKKKAHTLTGVSSRDFLQTAQARGWKNRNGKAECYYLPESMLMSISEGVRD